MSVASLVERLTARRPFWALYPTPRLSAVVFALALLWLVPGRAGTMASLIGIAAALVAVAIDWMQLPGRSHVSVRREIPPLLGLGDAEDSQVEIESRWSRPFTATVSHELPPTFDVIEPPIADVPPFGAVAVPLTFTPMRRGPVELGDLALRITTRLGLIARIVRVPLGGSAAVVPSLGNVRRFRLLALQHRLQDVGIRT